MEQFGFSKFLDCCLENCSVLSSLAFPLQMWPPLFWGEAQILHEQSGVRCKLHQPLLNQLHHDSSLAQYLLENGIILPAKVEQLKQQLLEVPPLGLDLRTAQTTPQTLPTFLVFNHKSQGKPKPWWPEVKPRWAR